MAWNYHDAREYLIRTFKGDFPPIIITAALTGGVHGKEVNAGLPETPEEQADDAYRSYKAGASIIHIHARDPNKGYASATSNSNDYYRVNKLVREKCEDVIISNTTGGGLGLTTEQRIKSLGCIGIISEALLDVFAPGYHTVEALI